LSGALLGLAQTGATQDELLSKILIARIINTAHGGTVIGSWEVDELPEEYVEACRALVFRLPGIQEGVRKLEEYMEERRKEHPQYRKYKQ
jgi:hypothetical protein